MSADDARYMARALTLARRGLYGTDPNPRVGCVLVRDGRVVGEGWHERAGEAHAEVHALRAAGEAAGGATAYVSLEPCSHHGLTPPCTEALIGAGVARVVCAMQDPNPRVAGEGFLRLEKAGISVETGPGAGEALELNRGFASRMRRGRPWVIAKVAASLDGRTAMASGESRWITSAAARDDVQHWRARAGGVLTGIDTVVADDPRLDVRREDLVGRVRQPLRIVADSRLRLPETARLLAGEGGGEVVVFTRSGDDRRVAALEAAGARIERQADDAAPVNLEGMLARIGALGVNELLVEAGRTLTGALAAAALVDEWIVYLAPRLMGDAARGLVRLPGIERLADTPCLEWREVRFVGPDLRLTLRSASGG